PPALSPGVTPGRSGTSRGGALYWRAQALHRVNPPWLPGHEVTTSEGGRMRIRLHLTPRCLHLLCLGWLLVIHVTSALGGVFQVVEEPPPDSTVAMVRQHVQGPLRLWTTVLTELFRLPTD